MEEARREVMAELDNEWHTLRHGNPVPGLYPQTGIETVKVRGHSEVVGEKTITKYEIVVTDEGEVVGTYHVVAEEKLGDYSSGYPDGEEQDDQDREGQG
jgi:hypothetical protein